MTYPVWHKLRGAIDANSEPLTLTDAKLHLRVDGNTEDPLIAALCTAVREDAENECNRALVNSPFTMSLHTFPCGSIVLPIGCQVANCVVTYVDADGVTQTLDPNAYTVLQRQNDFPEVVPVYGTSFPTTRSQPDAVTVTWDATPYPVPEALKASMKLQLAYLYENREPTKPETFAIDALRQSYQLTWWG
jgi:uncharacterized phiE125 gp8 family phage protein